MAKQGKKGLKKGKKGLKKGKKLSSAKTLGIPIGSGEFSPGNIHTGGILS
jgi:hypothetical protein